MHSFDQFQAQRDTALRDAVGKLPAGDRDTFLVQAILQRYSADRPREIATDVAGNGTSLLDLPSSGSDVFEESFSAIRSIEFPLGGVPPTLLLDEDFQLYRTPSGLKIMLISETPASTDTLRVTWTARHKDDGSTIPDPDFEAVCDYAAALCYEALAGIYAQTGDPTLAADAVNYRTKSQEYLGLANALRKRYYQHLGIDPSDAGTGVGPAIATGSLYETQGSGLDRMTHPRGSR